MAKKKSDAQQLELFEKQARLKSAVSEQAEELRMGVCVLEGERDALMRKKCDIEAEIQNRNVELGKLDLLLTNTIEKKRSLEVRIREMPARK